MPTPDTPSTAVAPDRWTAVRRFLNEAMPSLTLARALERGDLAFVQRWQQKLVQRGNDKATHRELQRHDAQGFTPLQQMARHGHADGVHHVLYVGRYDDLLLQRSRDGQRTLDLATGDARGAVQKGLQDGLRAAVKDCAMTAMLRTTYEPEDAARRDRANLQAMQRWLREGADPNLQTFDPQTGRPHPYGNALATCAHHGLLDACRLLLEHGADPSQRWLRRDPGGDRLSPEELESRMGPSLLQSMKEQQRAPGVAPRPAAQAVLDLLERREAVQLEGVVRDTLIEAAATAAQASTAPVPGAPAGTAVAPTGVVRRGRARL